MTARAQTAARLESDSAHVETGNLFVLHLSVMGSETPDSLNLGAWETFVAPKNFWSLSKWIQQGNLFTCNLTLQFFDADTITFSPLAITFSQQDTAFANPLDLIIYPTPFPDDLKDMAPIKDISREPILWTDYLPFAAAVLGVLAVLGLFFWWYSRYKQKAARSRSVELLPHELALKKLALLRQGASWRQGAAKEYCAALTFILREYIEKRYQVPALESTSEELLSQMKNTDFPLELKADLANVLMQADLAKFAKAIPPEDFYLYSMDFAVALVSRTIPEPTDLDAPDNPRLNQFTNPAS